MTIFEFQKKLQAITEPALQDVGMRVVLRNKDEYIYQQNRQMYAGKRWDQNLMVPYNKNYYPYAPWYQRWKQSLRGDANRVTLNLYGTFYDNMFIVAKGRDTFVISSRVRGKDGYDYQSFLESHYRWDGPGGQQSIWGIGGPYRSKFLNTIQPFFINEFITEFL